MDSATNNKSTTEVDDNDLSNSDIVTKYRTASNITNLALKKVISEVKPGASTKFLCDVGDNLVIEESGKLYNKKENGRKIEKGLAFPTCITLNEFCDFHSPITDSVLIKDGDVVKISLGCHIDGYIGVATHTVYVGDAITGRQADVLKAAWLCCEAALRKIKVGSSSTGVTEVIEKLASEFDCFPVVGFYSHEMKRHIIEGSRYFAGTTKVDDKCDSIEFGTNEVYSLNIILSTQDAKPKATEHQVTIYKTDIQNRYTLRTTLGRSFMSQVSSKFPALPFHIKYIEDERSLKVGLPEALRHNLVKPYPVTKFKTGEFVAHFQCTILLSSTGVKKIAGLPFEQFDICNSEHKVESEELNQLLSAPVNPKKKNVNKQ